MQRLRIWVGATVIWLFALYNVERLHEPINIASFVYVYTAACAMLILALQGTKKAARFWVYVPLIGLFLVLKWILGYPILGRAALPLTVTEVFALGITVALVRQVAWSIARFERGASDMMTMNMVNRASHFEAGQAEIYREIRRARKFERPLALVALAPTDHSMSASINRFIQEVQRETVKKYVSGQLGELLAQHTHDCDIITNCGDHFVLVLPEADGVRASKVVERVQSAAQESLGLSLRAGTVTFPSEEITFTGLLDRAEAQLRSQLERDGRLAGAGDPGKQRKPAIDAGV